MFGLLQTFNTGQIFGIPLSIIYGFSKKSPKVKKNLVLTTLIVRQNFKNLIYGDKLISGNYPYSLTSLTYLNSINSIYTQTQITDASSFNQFYFLSVMLVKILFELIVEHEIKYDSNILLLNRRNWYRNEIYKLYRNTIFRLSKRIMIKSFDQIRTLRYFISNGSVMSSIISNHFMIQFEFLTLSFNPLSSQVLFGNHKIELLPYQFVLQKQKHNNNLRFRFFRTFQHHFFVSPEKNNLNYSLLSEVNKPSINLVVFLNIVYQVRTTLLPRLYICQLFFFKVCSVLQCLYLFYIENLFYNINIKRAKIRFLFPFFYLYMLTTLLSMQLIVFNLDQKLLYLKNIFKNFWQHSKKYLQPKIIFKRNSFNLHKIGSVKYKFGLLDSNLVKYREDYLHDLIDWYLPRQYKYFKKTRRLKLKNKLKHRLIKLKLKKFINFNFKESINKKVLVKKKLPENENINEVNYINTSLDILNEIFINPLNRIIQSIRDTLARQNLKTNDETKKNPELTPFAIFLLFLKLNKLDLKESSGRVALYSYLIYLQKYKNFIILIDMMNNIIKNDGFLIHHYTQMNKKFYSRFVFVSNMTYAIFGKKKRNKNRLLKMNSFN